MIDKEDMAEIKHYADLIAGHIDSAVLSMNAINPHSSTGSQHLKDAMMQHLEAAGELTVKLDTALWTAVDAPKAGRVQRS